MKKAFEYMILSCSAAIKDIEARLVDYPEHFVSLSIVPLYRIHDAIADKASHENPLQMLDKYDLMLLDSCFQAYVKADESNEAEIRGLVARECAEDGDADRLEMYDEAVGKHRAYRAEAAALIAAEIERRLDY